MQFLVSYALKRLAEHNGPTGSCWDDPSNLERLNEARALIYENGDYEGTMDWFIANVSKCSCSFSPPARFDSIRELYECDKLIEVVDSPSMIIDCQRARDCCSGNVRVRARKNPRGNPYAAKPSCSFKIRIGAESTQDSGKTIEVVLMTSNSRRVRRTVTLQAEKSVRVDGQFSDVVSIVKPKTHGDVTMFAEVKGSECFVMAEIPGAIEIPRFYQYALSPSCRATQIVGYGKKIPLPLMRMDDVVDIESITALTFAYQALNAQSARDNKSFTDAIQLMRGAINLADQSLSEGEPSVSFESNLSSPLLRGLCD